MISPAWSAVTIAVLSDVATAPKRPSASRSAFVSCRPAIDAAELAADVRGDVEQARVRRDRLEREALDDGEDLVVDRHREGERAAQPAGGGRLGAREVRVLRARRRSRPGGASPRRGPGARRPARTPSARSASGRPRSGSGARSAPGATRAACVLGRRGRHGRRASRSSGRRARRRRASPRRWSRALLVAAATFSIRATKSESVARGMEGSGIHPPDRRFVERLEGLSGFLMKRAKFLEQCVSVRARLEFRNGHRREP